jgi:hypothetical protein
MILSAEYLQLSSRKICDEIMGKNLLFYRVVALKFHRDQIHTILKNNKYKKWRNTKKNNKKNVY